MRSRKQRINQYKKENKEKMLRKLLAIGKIIIIILGIILPLISVYCWFYIFNESSLQVDNFVYITQVLYIMAIGFYITVAGTRNELFLRFTKISIKLIFSVMLVSIALLFAVGQFEEKVYIIICTLFTGYLEYMIELDDFFSGIFKRLEINTFIYTVAIVLIMTSLVHIMLAFIGRDFILTLV